MASLIKVYCDSGLLAKLDEDVSKTDFSSRSKYLSHMLNFSLDSPPSFYRSCLERLVEDRKISDLLPRQYIEALAHSQNRNFHQMLRHMVEIARTHYPPQSFSDNSTNEEIYLPIGTLPPNTSSYSHWDADLA